MCQLDNHVINAIEQVANLANIPKTSIITVHAGCSLSIKLNQELEHCYVLTFYFVI